MNSRYILKFKRRRNGKTDYKFRYHILLSKKPRLVVRKTNTRIIVQVVEYTPEGDKTLIYYSSDMLNKNLGINTAAKNRMASYLTGYIIGKLSKEKKIKDMVLDIGLHKHHPKGRIYSVLKGVLDQGIEIPHSDKILPDIKLLGSINGKDYSKDLEKYKKIIDENKDGFYKNKKENKTKTKKVKTKK